MCCWNPRILTLHQSPTILDKINGKPRPPPLPLQIKDGKMARFCSSCGFILDLGGIGVCCSILFCPRFAILDKINGKPRPPPPLPLKSRMGKWRVFALRVASSLIWGGRGFAVPFYFVQDCS